MEEWGFEVLKLDFLYASCLSGNGKYDSTMSRAEAMHLGLRTIQAAAKNVSGDAFIIGCGCPIGSAVGFVDGMRVSCDTGPTWVPEFPLPSWDNGTLPALRGMLRNTMSRAPFGHRWVLDDTLFYLYSKFSAAWCSISNQDGGTTTRIAFCLETQLN